jgi:hypothetical protein
MFWPSRAGQSHGADRDRFIRNLAKQHDIHHPGDDDTAQALGRNDKRLDLGRRAPPDVK